MRVDRGLHHVHHRRVRSVRARERAHAEALRRIGLLRPARVDPSTGYRRYDPSQLSDLLRIVDLRGFGCSLDDAAEVLSSNDRHAPTHAILVHNDVLDLVQLARAAGSLVYLATNQDPGRARHMKSALGYDRLLDGGYYSCDLGVAKPAREFFQLIIDDLGAHPSDVVFIDDVAENVAAASALGIQGILWKHGDPIRTLRVALLDDH